MPLAMELVESLAAKFSALLPHLDERQRRLYLGSEARALVSLGGFGDLVLDHARPSSSAPVSPGMLTLRGHPSS
jgi:hypothetical protein